MSSGRRWCWAGRRTSPRARATAASWRRRCHERRYAFFAAAAISPCCRTRPSSPPSSRGSCGGIVAVANAPGARIARRGHGFAGEGGEVMSMTPRPVEPAEVLAGPRARATVREAYPPFEGSNIGVWLGFKHFMYLMEEAAIQHVRERWLGPRALWEQHGVGVEIVDSSIRILTALHLDQLTRAEVRPREGSEECELAAILEAQDGGQWVPAA